MENNTVKVNELPSLTWHRLHVNSCKMQLFAPEKPSVIKADAENGNVKFSSVESKTYNSSIETGVGRAADHLFKWGMSVDISSGRDDILRMEIESEDEKDNAAFVEVNAEENSKLTIVQIWRANNSKTAFRTIVDAKEGSSVKLIQIITDRENESINDIGCVTEKNASFEVVRLYLSQENIISGVRTDLIGDSSSFVCKSGYLVKSGKKLDMNVIANHIGKNTQSDIRAEGTLYDGAEKTFRGTIDLRKGCSGSEGKEEENVLLLGDDVINKTIPLILCTEEDVKGSHGASIGELEQSVLFYFEARGIDKSEAEKIVTKARLERLCQDTADEKAAEYMHQIIEEVI